MTPEEFIKHAGIKFINDVLEYEHNNETSFNFDFDLEISDGRVLRLKLQEEE